MAGDSPSANLQIVLARHSKKISKPKGAVLFRCGEKASGVFLIFRGEVSLEVGSAPILVSPYGPGALVGLPATITRGNYSTTATVTENAQLGFLSPQCLDSLLHNRPELCHDLMVILGNRIAENHALVRTSLMHSA